MKSKTVWVLCHIDNKHHKSIQKDLIKHGYGNLKVYVPLVNVLKKSFKGKDVFDEVPVLFSYGFIRMTKKEANSRTFLFKLKKRIDGIHSWVKSLDSLYGSKKRKRIDNSEDWDDFSIAATVPRSDIRRFRRLERDNKIYSNDEIANITPGKYLVLRGYPYEGVEGTVLEVDTASRLVKMLLYPQYGKIEVMVSFDNIIYSVYHDYDPDKLHYSHNEDNCITTNNLTDDIIWQ